GVVVATAGSFALNHFWGPGIDPVHLAILAPVGTVHGQIGDLAESLLKRSTGVKASGRIMPGHGGLFDRIDALIFVGPLLLAYAVLIRNDTIAWLDLI
ncbi:MAG: phosphatidate cytidylyltransferase, partial [Deltaproteobacteria bacterium]